MNNDGFGQSGIGPNDDRIAGEDLQHNRQARTADEAPNERRRVKVGYQDGGPMLRDMHDRDESEMAHENKRANNLQNMISQEKSRHEDAVDHQNHHLENHHKRPHDMQYGHDNHQHNYQNMEM